jgi:hypothetical protein
MIADWQEFKLAFKSYITNTIGIFTQFNPANLTHFNLDAFLNKLNQNTHIMVINTQFEALSALSTFINIQEYHQNIHVNIIPMNVKLQFKTLIERNLLHLSLYSEIKTACMNVFTIEGMLATAAAA